ncbi:MAG: AI-2E family transporter [Verrucomicrobia bacterium]|nr:AI-2E family transporter [Verrucomicrobiota bacterium]
MKVPETQTASAPDSPDLGSRGPARTLVLIVATALGVFICYRLAAPFLNAIIWALALAVLFASMQSWMESKLRRPTLAALVTVMTVGLLVCTAVTFVGQHLLHQAAKGAETIDASVKSGEWRSVLAKQPRLAWLADRIEHPFDLPGTAQALASRLSTAAQSLVMGSLVQAMSFILTFYLLFFFLRDREAVLKSLRSLSPLAKDATTGLFVRIRDTIYATVYGTLAVASVQGLLGGLMFWWLGLAEPLLWGLVMALLSVVPVAGAFVVWIPAAIYLALDGSWGKAVILTLWGALVVGTIDNILRPVFVGNRLKLHTVLVFISVVGGLIVFGAVGLILGPVALTITLALLESWRGRSDKADPAKSS